ncbi:recombinase family protein [Nocardia altamirensis]|uniref:recombinase family protein n=1 Tax=Nocardia altamirensis TaxID=472158 RepID=UPI001435598B|nr:recombinase family protein [Nocardia altamirensis]
MLRRVVTMRHNGMTYDAISTALNTKGITTPAGRPRWQRSHVWRLVRTAEAEQLLGRLRAK